MIGGAEEPASAEPNIPMAVLPMVDLTDSLPAQGEMPFIDDALPPDSESQWLQDPVLHIADSVPQTLEPNEALEAPPAVAAAPAKSSPTPPPILTTSLPQLPGRVVSSGSGSRELTPSLRRGQRGSSKPASR